MMPKLAYYRPYPKRQFQDPCTTLCVLLGYDVGNIQKLELLELFDYLTLFQYPGHPEYLTLINNLGLVSRDQ